MRNLKKSAILLIAAELCIYDFSSRANAVTPTLIYTAPQTGGPGITLVQIFPHHENPTPGPCIAMLEDTVELRVDRLADWLNAPREKAIITSTKQGDDLVNEQVPRFCLFINNQPMRTLQASGWLRDDPSWPGHEKMTDEEKAVPRYWIRFPLHRDVSNAQNKTDWSEVLKTPGITPQMDLTLGFYHADQNAAEALTSWVTRSTDKADRQFKFSRLRWDFWSIAGIVVLGLSLILFVMIVFLGGLVREPSLAIREDGLPPVSLGRCQMAFWFFLVATAFVFLWLITGRGDLDTINSTVLTLIGISAGTALGAAFITSNTADPFAAAQAPRRNYPKEIADAKDALARAGDEPARQVQRVRIAQIKTDFREYRRKHWNQWFLDLLSEEVDTSKRQTMSFHRFQIVVWTLVLGLIFCSEVYTKLSMPTFDSTLLILMGISSGTYLGFKFPSAGQQQPPGQH